MRPPAYNTVAWFQVGTTDAEQAKRFYGDLFGWRYALDPNSEGKYHLVSYSGADTPSGGIFDTGGEFPNHAIFMVVVQDGAAVCAQVERLGGKVLVAPTTRKGGLVFADLHDPVGDPAGLFTPPPASPPGGRAPGTRPSPGSWRFPHLPERGAGTRESAERRSGGGAVASASLRSSDPRPIRSRRCSPQRSTTPDL